MTPTTPVHTQSTLLSAVRKLTLCDKPIFWQLEKKKKEKRTWLTGKPDRLTENTNLKWSFKSQKWVTGNLESYFCHVCNFSYLRISVSWRPLFFCQRCDKLTSTKLLQDQLVSCSEITSNVFPLNRWVHHPPLSFLWLRLNIWTYPLAFPVCVSLTWFYGFGVRMCKQRGQEENKSCCSPATPCRHPLHAFSPRRDRTSI